jgi:hypothetical protein
MTSEQKRLGALADQYGEELEEARRMRAAGMCSDGDVKECDRRYCAAIKACLESHRPRHLQ